MCVYSRGYCTCDRPYGSTTVVLENSFFSKIDKHVCKLEPFLSTQYLTSTTRTQLTESGSYRTEQTLTKSLVDHLHRNRMEPRQAQFIVNKLAELTHAYGSKIANRVRPIIGYTDITDTDTDTDNRYRYRYDFNYIGIGIGIGLKLHF